MSNSVNNQLRERFDRAVHLNKTGRASAAIAILRALARRHPDSGAVLGYLAGIHFRTGRFDLAAKLFRQVTQLSPNSELASRGLVHSLLDLGKKQDAIRELRRFLSHHQSPDLREMLNDLVGRPVAKSA